VRVLRSSASGKFVTAPAICFDNRNGSTRYEAVLGRTVPRCRKQQKSIFLTDLPQADPVCESNSLYPGTDPTRGGTAATAREQRLGIAFREMARIPNPGMAAMPVIKSNADSSGGGNGPITFVIEVSDRAAFAFEARSSAQAEEFTRLPWFTRALEDYCLSSCKMTISEGFLRAATDWEASIYQDLANEFAGATNDFLVVSLSSLTGSSEM
jgi:hypothetical protein